MKRFDASRIAFHSLSRKLGEPWIEPYLRRARERAARDPAARRDLAALAGARAFNVLVGPYGEGRENRGFLSWRPEGGGPAARLEFGPEEATAWVTELAVRLGGATAGVAALDPAWVYERVQQNPYAPGPPRCKPIEIGPADEPGETEQALVLPERVRYAVVVAVAMDRGRLGADPVDGASVETNLGYSRMATVVVSLAAAIRAAGYHAVPCMNDTALSVPLAVAAGLGLAGRHGMLIARGHGAAVRIAKVLTDLELAPAEPPARPFSDTCASCGICATACPAGAIPAGAPTSRAVHPCTAGGVEKWPVDAEACLAYWVERGASCALCQAVCPLS